MNGLLARIGLDHSIIETYKHRWFWVISLEGTDRMLYRMDYRIVHAPILYLMSPGECPMIVYLPQTLSDCSR